MFKRVRSARKTTALLMAAMGLVGAAGVAGTVGGRLGAQSVGTASGPVSDWKIVFSDEFDGTTLDTSKWGTCFPKDRWSPDNCLVNGGLSPESSTSEDARIEVTGGLLKLWTEKRPITSSVNGVNYEYRSAMVQARRALSAPNANADAREVAPVTTDSDWTHVYMEARIKIPNGVGLWPSFWMMPADRRIDARGWPYTGELDAMEYLPDAATQGPGGDRKFVQNLIWHGEITTVMRSDCIYPGSGYDTSCSKRHLASATPWNQFHTFGIERSFGGVAFYIDRQLVRFYPRFQTKELSGPTDLQVYPFDQPFFPILRLAMSFPNDSYYLTPDTSTWPQQSPVPGASMDVDYFRVYKRLDTVGGNAGVTGPRPTIPATPGVAPQARRNAAPAPAQP